MEQTSVKVPVKSTKSQLLKKYAHIIPKRLSGAYRIDNQLVVDWKGLLMNYTQTVPELLDILSMGLDEGREKTRLIEQALKYDEPILAIKCARHVLGVCLTIFAERSHDYCKRIIGIVYSNSSKLEVAYASVHDLLKQFDLLEWEIKRVRAIIDDSRCR